MKGVKIKKIELIHIDKRGTITDLLNEKINHVGLIITEKNAERANHYHKISTQYSYILSGKFEVFVAKVNNFSKVEKVILKAGEIIIISPMIVHRFKALERAVMIDMISESRAKDSYEKDTIRVTLK